MRQLELGRPVLANDVGGFAELPEGSLVRVPPEDDDALAAALRRLVDDPQLRASVGAAAREAAGKRSLDRYAREFLAFVEEVRSWTPIVRTIDLAAFELGRMGVDERFGEIGRIAHELGTIVDAMAPEPLLRLLGPEDLVALKLFFRENNTPAVTTNFHPFPLSDEVAEDIGLRAGRDRYFGAFARGRLVGLSMLRGWNEGFDIPSFGIAVDHREHGKGIGQALTDFTLDRAPWLGAEQVRLTVYASNRVAHAMYVGRGFEEQSREPVTLDGGADERIVMVKELTGTVQTEVGA
jgi:GNAT superfamily N-acetyltransferase